MTVFLMPAFILFSVFPGGFHSLGSHKSGKIAITFCADGCDFYGFVIFGAENVEFLFRIGGSSDGDIETFCLFSAVIGNSVWLIHCIERKEGGI